VKNSLIVIALLACFFSKGQDKIYFLTGDMKEGTVKEIGPEYIKFISEGVVNEIESSKIILLEFSNGSVEVINKPTESLVFTPSGIENNRQEKNAKSLSKTNYVSLNTLALFNTDLAIFYEKIFTQESVGLGVMGAYNFNNYAGFMNNFISILGNAKKNYDLGAFFNYYLTKMDSKKLFSLGLMIKYTDIKFDLTVPTGGGNFTNVQKKGSQTSTIFTFSTLRHFSNNIFIKTLYGLGGFNLKGDYRKEFNYIFSSSGQQVYNIRFLPKLYFGVNVGVNF
jgi:hypothetical protein